MNVHKYKFNLYKIMNIQVNHWPFRISKENYKYFIYWWAMIILQ